MSSKSNKMTQNRQLFITRNAFRSLILKIQNRFMYMFITKEYEDVIEYHTNNWIYFYLLICSIA